MGPEERELAPGSFALDAVFERLAPVRIEEEGVRLAEDPEYLHRMRVATRRLRSALPLLSESVSRGDLAAWSRDVRRFTQVLGKARDGDVQGFFVAEFLKNNTTISDVLAWSACTFGSSSGAGDSKSDWTGKWTACSTTAACWKAWKTNSGGNE